MEKEDGQSDQRSLQEVWSPDNVSAGVSDGVAAEGVRVRSVHRGASAGTPSRSPEHTRQAAIDRRLKTKQKSCDICGYSFVVSGKEQWKGRCGECAPPMRQMFMTCPGCGNRYEYYKLQVVSMNVSPGKKGGKKYQVRYCVSCMNKLKARADKMRAEQKQEWDSAAADQKRLAKDMRA